MTALALEPDRPDRRGIRPGFLALLWLVAAAGLLALAATQTQRSWTPPPRTAVVLEGEHYRLEAAQLDWLKAFSQLHFSEGRDAARGLLADELGAGLDDIFGDVRARLPQFADWYYSLGGEYSRLGMAALARLSLADGDFVAGKATSMLFPDKEWERALGELDLRMSGTLQAHQLRLGADWLAQVSNRLAPYRVPAPLESARSADWSAPLRLDGFIGRWLAEEQEDFQSRVRLSTAAGGGAAAGVVLWRRAAARAAAASGRAVAARSTGRVAARAGTAASGGLAVCAATGPAAAGCALLAGAAAWLATDWALLRIEEARNRDELLAALEAGLDQFQAQMQADVLAAYDAVTREQEERAGAVITRAFSPAQAGR